MNERIRELAEQAGLITVADVYLMKKYMPNEVKFAELIVAECINKIETYQIPVGNSAAGEMACRMTYYALKEIRDEIKEHFEVTIDERTN